MCSKLIHVGKGALRRLFVSGSGLARLSTWPSHLSHRSRIALAFVALILTSASCTILIGNAVFGRKARELARARLQLDLEVVEQVLLGRLDLLRWLASSLAGMAEADDRTLAARSLGSSSANSPVDFVGVLDPDGKRAVLYRRGTGRAADVEDADLGRLPGSELAAFASLAVSKGRAISGFVPLAAPELSLLAGPIAGDEQDLASVAASPIARGRVLFLGCLATRQIGFVASTLERLAGSYGVTYEASIIIGDRRIATTLGPWALGTRAAPEAVAASVERAGTFAGRSDVAGSSMDTAYRPLRGFRGNVAGMLEIGTDQDVYGEIRRKTASLFTAIIAGGMAFGLLMAWLFSATLVRPLKDLAHGMDRVARGDLDLKVRIDSADELGQLSRAFNVMVRAVKERDLRLHEMTHEKLSQVEKQVSVGRLAAGIAHEINNPLTAILSLSMLLRKTLPPDDPRRSDLDIVVKETTRCREIVTNLLDFARERPPSKRVVDVNQVMRETLALTARYEALSQIRLDVRLSATPLLVNADPTQIQQVFTNVILNAAEATPAGGAITIGTDEDSSGGFVVVRVEDTGKGIPEPFVDRVFEPFFTTKGTGKGTGLGLSVSLGIIQKHDGAIDLESREGEGTKVTITLPRARPGGASRSAPVPGRRGSGTASTRAAGSEQE